MFQTDSVCDSKLAEAAIVRQSKKTFCSSDTYQESGSFLSATAGSTLLIGAGWGNRFRVSPFRCTRSTGEGLLRFALGEKRLSGVGSWTAIMQRIAVSSQKSKCQLFSSFASRACCSDLSLHLACGFEQRRSA